MNHYDVLGVERSASQAEIGAAYRRLSKLHHPDVASGPDERMKQINYAYWVLRDDERRRAYDREIGVIGRRRPGTPAGGSPTIDMFLAVFGATSPNPAARAAADVPGARSQDTRGADGAQVRPYGALAGLCQRTGSIVQSLTGVRTNLRHVVVRERIPGAFASFSHHDGGRLTVNRSMAELLEESLTAGIDPVRVVDLRLALAALLHEMVHSCGEVSGDELLQRQRQFTGERLLTEGMTQFVTELLLPGYLRALGLAPGLADVADDRIAYPGLVALAGGVVRAAQGLADASRGVLLAAYLRPGGGRVGLVALLTAAGLDGAEADECAAAVLRRVGERADILAGHDTGAAEHCGRELATSCADLIGRSLGRSL